MQTQRTFLKQCYTVCISMSVMGVLLDSRSVSQQIFKPAIQEDTLVVAMENF